MRSRSFSTEGLCILLFTRSKEKGILTVELLGEPDNRIVVIIRMFAETALTSFFMFQILSRYVSFVLFESIFLNGAYMCALFS